MDATFTKVGVGALQIASPGRPLSWPPAVGGIIIPVAPVPKKMAVASRLLHCLCFRPGEGPLVIGAFPEQEAGASGNHEMINGCSFGIASVPLASVRQAVKGHRRSEQVLP